jgi:hypothetical protein
MTRDDVQPTGMSFSQQSFASSSASPTFSEFLADDAERDGTGAKSRLPYAFTILRRAVGFFHLS